MLASQLRISSGGEYVIHQSRLRMANGGEYLVSAGHPSSPKETNWTSAAESILVLTEGEARHLPANSFQSPGDCLVSHQGLGPRAVEGDPKRRRESPYRKPKDTLLRSAPAAFMIP